MILVILNVHIAGFLERGFIYIKVCVWGGGGGFALLILSHFT